MIQHTHTNTHTQTLTHTQTNTHTHTRLTEQAVLVCGKHEAGFHDLPAVPCLDNGAEFHPASHLSDHRTPGAFQAAQPSSRSSTSASNVPAATHETVLLNHVSAKTHGHTTPFPDCSYKVQHAAASSILC